MSGFRLLIGRFMHATFGVSSIFSVFSILSCFGFLGFVCFFSFLSFLCTPGKAAPCCARNSATPSLILGDDRGQINLGAALGHVVAEVFDRGVPAFKSPANTEVTQTYRLDGATILSDRFQMGGSVSMVRHTVGNDGLTESTIGMGDTRLSLGYEILPAWTYSRWKPQGFIFSVLSLPTGRSKFESQRTTLADISGNGFYSVSVGAILLKRWDLWDVFILPEMHYSLSRTFQSDHETTRASPGWGGSSGFGVGWSPGGGNIRIGFRLQPRLDQGIQTEVGGRISKPGWVSNCDTGLDASYLLSVTDTLMMSYTDQTVFGVAMNSNLNRVFAVNFQHRWER